ncbi:hypothetical protein FRX31_025302 [Thalictrum thalictroides]|uniref:Uncharacterized protein n=1 Tax=Thalictrum thalictroides TaxID=46969 RepID=A0A7J6VLV0_THATH|nr:hypothetical protein FRX31_025302 [Thalictrum thalictroides]
MANEATLNLSKALPPLLPTSPTPFTSNPPPSTSDPAGEKNAPPSEGSANQNWLVVDLNCIRAQEQAEPIPAKQYDGAGKDKRWSSLLRNPPPSAGKEDLSFIDPTYEGENLIIEDEILEE